MTGWKLWALHVATNLRNYYWHYVSLSICLLPSKARLTQSFQIKQLISTGRNMGVREGVQSWYGGGGGDATSQNTTKTFFKLRIKERTHIT